MKRPRRLRVMVAVVLGLGAPVVNGCGKGVLSHADASAMADFSFTACDTLNLPDGCHDICLQAQDILFKDCASCHNVSSQTPPVAITDYRGLVNVLATDNFPDEVYVAPGNIDESLLYQRAAILRDMPPPASDSSYPRPTASNTDVLAQWIRTCVPAMASPYVRCPFQPPTGSCSIPGMTCPYSDQTCACNDGSWDCQPCPATQPLTGTPCPTAPSSSGGAAPFRCGYGGGEVCTCMPDPADLNPPAWECGVCPASEPVAGQDCGDMALSCAYPDRQCNCHDGVWGCESPRCPVPSVPDATIPPICEGFYGCNYPDLDQSCTCNTPIESSTDVRAMLNCICPGSPPVDRTDCVLTNTSPCAYSDRTCTCVAGHWQCQEMCPAAMPTSGSSCSPGLTCSYGNHFCDCDEGVWRCS